ncbi:hypothetical protein [Methylobacterium oryzisoli]|uniref:hypothetical protein n=1 Tax=Methylobacterium oryzisoli TaxID=3385502 RepID=UPI003891AECD
MRFPTLAAKTIQPRSSVAPGGAKLRLILVFATLLTVAAAGTWVATAPARPLDPGLARVIGFMALVKAGLAANALAACHWRLAQPARAWRAAAYVAGPPLMVVGVILLWSLCEPGLGALGFYLGLLAVLAAAFTDEDFFPDPRPQNN